MLCVYTLLLLPIKHLIFVYFIVFSFFVPKKYIISGSKHVECVWNLMAHGDAREGKWRGNWWLEWVASTLTLPRNVVYPALLTLMCTPRLPAVDWTDAPAYLNGLVRFGDRRNLVSARVPSRFKRTITLVAFICDYYRCHWYKSFALRIVVLYLSKVLCKLHDAIKLWSADMAINLDIRVKKANKVYHEGVCRLWS